MRRREVQRVVFLCLRDSSHLLALVISPWRRQNFINLVETVFIHGRSRVWAVSSTLPVALGQAHWGAFRLLRLWLQVRKAYARVILQDERIHLLTSLRLLQLELPSHPWRLAIPRRGQIVGPHAGQISICSVHVRRVGELVCVLASRSSTFGPARCLDASHILLPVALLEVQLFVVVLIDRTLRYLSDL